MPHIYILYYFVALITGFCSTAMLIVIFSRTKNRWFLYYILFYSAFTLIIINIAVRTYLEINMTRTYLEYARLQYLLSFIFQSLLVFTGVILTNFFLSVTHTKIINTVSFILLVSVVAYTIFFKKINSNSTSPDYNDILFLCAFIYIIIRFIINYKKLAGETKKSIARQILILSVIFFPCIYFDFINIYTQTIKITPALYCIFGIIIAVHSLKYYYRQSRLKADNFYTENDPLFERYGISNREKEILYFIMKGFGNKKIADSLYISVSTVKAHNYSIFKKINVKNRYELIQMLKY